MSEQREDRRSSVWWMVLLMPTPVLYVLSCGPAFVIVGKTMPSDWTIDHYRTVYEPVRWLADHTGTMDLLLRYLKWWIHLFS